MSNLEKRVVSPATQEATPSTSGGGKEGVKVPISAAASRRRRAEVIGTVRKIITTMIMITVMGITGGIARILVHILIIGIKV